MIPIFFWTSFLIPFAVASTKLDDFLPETISYNEMNLLTGLPPNEERDYLAYIIFDERFDENEDYVARIIPYLNEWWGEDFPFTYFSKPIPSPKDDSKTLLTVHVFNNPTGDFLCWPLSYLSHRDQQITNIDSTSEYALVPMFPKVDWVSESEYQRLFKSIVPYVFRNSIVVFFIPVLEKGLFTIYGLNNYSMNNQEKEALTSIEKFCQHKNTCQRERVLRKLRFMLQRKLKYLLSD